MQTITATYSPDDNKLRLTASHRLDAETYARVKAAGFIWAPKLEQFIAPMWTPARADLAMELAGEIEDDDGSLMERAEVRAERFEEYKEKRASEADRALDHVHAITSNIPLGQPIMIGHHSQKQAERDARRIEAGMRRAVDLFDTSQYWKRRAAAAIRHAKYKEAPEVRHRRIKGIEADARKQEKTIDEHEKAARIWSKVPRLEWDKQTAFATYIAGRMSVGSYGTYSDLNAGRMHGDTAWRAAVAQCEQVIAHARRWLDHMANRLEYERAMLGDSGGIAAAYRLTGEALRELAAQAFERERADPTRSAAAAHLAQVDTFVNHALQRRAHWATGRGPFDSEIAREAQILDGCAAQPDVRPDLASASAAAACRLREMLGHGPAPEHVPHAGRVYRVLAAFPADDSDSANRYMAVHPGAALLCTVNGRLMLADKDDLGTTSMPTEMELEVSSGR